MSEFQFKVGDKVRLGSWLPAHYTKIEWVGDLSFAGVNEAGHRLTHPNCADWLPWVKTYHFPFKVGDYIRLMDAAGGQTYFADTVAEVGSPTDAYFRCTGTDYRRAKEPTGGYYWELVPEPKPVVKCWLVTTEHRLAKPGEVARVQNIPNRFNAEHFWTVDPGCNDGQLRDVVTSVQPLTNVNDWIVGGDGK